MSIVVLIFIVGAIISLCVGLGTAMLTILSSGRVVARRPIMMRTGPIYWAFTMWTIVLGAVLLFAPDNWFGPSWTYFTLMPRGGKGMGGCLIFLSSLQMIALVRDWPARVLSILFFLNGFVYWTAGIMLGAEGLLGHQGLMEAPFMLYVGAHAFAHSASLTAYSK